MSDIQALLQELVVGNRILASEGVVDGYGHLSVRHPDDAGRFFIAWSRAPALVNVEDIVELTLDCQPVQAETRPLYLERFIHGAIYEARPDINAVVHAHAEDVLPFGISSAPLLPVIHSGAFIGGPVPVWDIAERFGDSTNLLVTNMEQGRDLAKKLGEGAVALMRGHGFASAASSVREVVRLSVYLPRNARVQMHAMQLGGMKPLNPGEIATRRAGPNYRPDSPETWRGWEYWATKAGCADMLPPRPRS